MRHYADTDEFTAPYAADLQKALLELAHRHDNVTLSQQISILGITIGLIIDQIPIEHRDQYHELLISNMIDAKYCAEIVALH